MRLRDDYPVEEFRLLIMRRREMLGLSLKTLAARASMNHGSLSAILRGDRTCQREARQRLLDAVRAKPRERAKVGSPTAGPSPSSPFVIPDTDDSPLHARLNRGQEFLFRAQYGTAFRNFWEVHSEAKNRLIKADALMRIGWAHFEMGNTGQCEKYINASLSMIALEVDEDGINKIVSSMGSKFSTGPCSPKDEVTRVLNATLHLRAKYLAERVAHRREKQYTEEAKRAFHQTLSVSSFREDGNLQGHDKRWRAVLLAFSREWAAVSQAKRCLDESRACFRAGSLESAYLTRDTGLVQMYTEDPWPAKQTLRRAIGQFAAHGDARPYPHIDFAACLGFVALRVWRVDMS